MPEGAIATEQASFRLVAQASPTPAGPTTPGPTEHLYSWPPCAYVACATPAQPKVTAQPIGGSGGGSGTPTWMKTTDAFEASVLQTYGIDVPTAIDALWGLEIYVPGRTPEEIAADKAYAKLVFTPAVNSINSLLAFMNTHPAATCFANAYMAARSIAKTWLSYLQSYDYPGDITPSGRQAAYAWTAARSTMDTFVAHLPSYFSACK
jgi:hypothetical protein